MNNFQRDVHQLFFNERLGGNHADEIREHAFDLYRRLKLKFRKRENYLSLLFFCLWCAHKQFKETIDPHDLADCLGVTSISKSLKTFAEHKTGYRIPEYTFTEIDFIDYYNKQLKFPEEVIQHLKSIAVQLMSTYPTLNLISPQTIAGAIFIHHCRANSLRYKDRIMKMIHKKSSILVYQVTKKIATLRR